MTLAVTGGLLHSAGAAKGIDRDIVVAGETIVDIVPRGSVKDLNAEVIDASRRLIIPGLINSHTHSNGGLSKGIGDRWSLELLLNALPWIGGNRGAHHKHLATLINAVEQVEKGTTACYDLFYEFPVPSEEGLAAVAGAYDAVGMRAVVAPMVADRTFYQSVPGLLEALPEEFRERAGGMRMTESAQTLQALADRAKRWPHSSDRLRLGIAPTIAQHCSREFMVGCAQIARDHGLVMQSHVSEPRYLSASSFAVSGMSMTEILDDCGIIGPWFSAAHAIWITEQDMDILAKKGAQIAHNPSANLRLGAGIAAIRECVRRGIPVGIGTDGAPTSSNQNMFEAMRYAAYVSRIRGLPLQDWVSAAEAFAMATEGSARILGMHEFIGKIAVGYKADLVLLDTDAAQYIPFNDATNQMVQGEDGTAVDKVLIGGKLVVSGGRALDVDRSAMARQAEQAIEDFASLNAPARHFAEGLEVAVSKFCRCLGHDEKINGLKRDIHPPRVLQ